MSCKIGTVVVAEPCRVCGRPYTSMVAWPTCGPICSAVMAASYRATDDARKGSA